MDFPKFDFEVMNESDIREEIIAPMLRYWGYRTGTLHNLVREQYLSYPRLALGRRTDSDPFLRGRADYICEAGRLIRWVIEAKAPNQQLDSLVEEQAWTYANHQEVRAVYFAITNGRTFKLFQTNHATGNGPIFESSYDEMSEKLDTLTNLLSPDAVLRDWPTQVPDPGVPIGPGLRSIARVTGGEINYTRMSLPIPALKELIMTVPEGSVERTEDGSLVANLSTLVPFKSLQELNRKLGLDSICLTSGSKVVSTSLSEPTTFKSEKRTILPASMQALNLQDWQQFTLPCNVSVLVVTRAVGHLDGKRFVGTFFATIAYVELRQKVDLEGAFELYLS